MNAVPPLPLRKLRAEMQLKNLSLREVSERSGVRYAQASQVLKGRLIHPGYLELIRRVIKAAPHPLEVAA